MKPIPGIILLLSILGLTACATPTSEYNKAKEINTIDSYRSYIEAYPYSPYTKAAKDKIAEISEKQRKEIQLKNNWGKLSKGMSVDEVDSLIGPLNRGAVISIKKLAEKNQAREGGDSFPYRGHYFTLIFDSHGRLSEWSLK